MRLNFFSAISTSDRIDKDSGVIHGVSVITSGPAQGHDLTVDGTTLNQVLGLCSQFKDGLKVRLNHPVKGKDAQIQSIAGLLKNFRIESDKVKADLHLLKTDDYFAKVLEMSEKIPSEFGLSISYAPMPGEKDEGLVRISEIYACDLVDSPAANPSGLFSKMDDSDGDEQMCMHCGKHDNFCSCKPMGLSDDHYSEYGDVPYADSENHKYPIDTGSHVRAAWSYINMPKNAKKYSPDKLAKVKAKIKGAAKKHGIKISEQHSDPTKTSKTKHMSTLIAKSLGLAEDATEEQIAAELSKRLATPPKVDLSEITGQITELSKKLNSVDLATMDSKLKELQAAQEAGIQLARKSEIDNLLAEAAKEGKQINLDLADIYEVKDGKITVKIEPSIVGKMLSKLPKNVVPLTRRQQISEPPKKDGKELEGDAIREFCIQKRAEGEGTLNRLFESMNNPTAQN